MCKNLFSRWNKPETEAEKEERIDKLMARIDSLPPSEQTPVDRLIEKLVARRERITAKRTKKDVPGGRK